MSLLVDYRTAMAGQYEAALRTLMQCVEMCPTHLWNEPVAKNPFCECVFHALFYADLYLGQDVASLREQEFHQSHPEIFRDYEELENREPKLLYDVEMITEYFKFVAEKMEFVVSSETEETLAQPVDFEWLEIRRIEMHPYNIRHIHHHAAQLILKLRLESEANPIWYRTRQVRSTN